MIKRRAVLAGFLRAVCATIVFGQTFERAAAMSGQKTTIKDISLADLKSGLADGSIILVDVREANEWDAGHIPGALFNPLSSFDVSKLPQEKNKTIVMVCRSGRRSQSALEITQMHGRVDVDRHFSGGMLAWEAAGEKIAR